MPYQDAAAAAAVVPTVPLRDVAPLATNDWRDGQGAAGSRRIH
jgi:hypothetical protein